MRLEKKTSTWWCVLIGFFYQDFVTRFWTTVGDTVYVPSIYDNDYDWGAPTFIRRHSDVLAHEADHTEQWKKWGHMVMWFLILLPFYGRWLVERGPFLNQLKRNPTEERIKRFSRAMWTDYKAWFPCLAERWFRNKLNLK